MSLDLITPAVQRLDEYGPDQDTLAVTLRMVMREFTQADLDVAAELDLLTCRQYEDLTCWLGAHRSTAGTLIGGRR